MKNKYRALVLLLCLLVFSSMPSGVDAQENNTPNTSASLELNEAKSLWKKSSNAAGLLLDKPIKYSTFDIGQEHTSGSFKRPQQGKVINKIGFNTEGATFLRDFYVWGYFNYSRDAINNADFNASITDPYRGMPYMVADLNTSDWRNQYYDMEFKFATPRYFGVWSFGLDGSYSVAQAAKQRDVRTRNLFYQLEVKPGMVYSPNSRHHIGANFSYRNVKEDVNASIENTDDKQIYYILYGLGSAKMQEGSGRTIDYKGDEFGGSLQYNYQEGGIGFLVSGEYLSKSETAVFGFTDPEQFGATRENKWIAAASAYRDGKKYTNTISARYVNSKTDGIQYISEKTSTEGWIILDKKIRSTYDYHDFNLGYSLISKRDNEYAWKLGLNLGYQKINNEYILPYSFKNVKNRFIEMSGKVNLKISDKLVRRLAIGGSFKYNSNVNGEYSYNGNSPDSPIVTGLEQADFNYLMSDYYQLSGDIMYSQKWKEDSPANLFIKGVFLFREAKDFDFGTRKIVQISIGGCF